MLTNKQWMWKNWQSVYFITAMGLTSPLFFMLLFKIKTPFIYLGLICLIPSISILIYALLKADQINQKYEKEILNSDLLQYIYTNNVKGLENLNLTTKELNFPLPNNLCLLYIAAACGNLDTINYLIAHKYVPKNYTESDIHPIHIAANAGHFTVVKTLMEFYGDKIKALTFTPFMLDCFLGNRDKILNSSKEFLAQEKDYFSQTALYYALTGKADELTILHLLKLKSNINNIGKKINVNQFKKGSTIFFNQATCHKAFGTVSEEVLIEILSREKSFPVEETTKKNVLMMATHLGLIRTVSLLKNHISVLEADSEGKDSLAYAKLSKNFELEKIIRDEMEIALNKERDLAQKRKSQQIAMGANFDKNHKIKIEIDDLKMMLFATLRNLVDVEHFIDNFSYDLKNFMDKKSGSDGIVLWGNSGVGKTEIARRLSGAYKDSIAKFELPGVEIRYIACCDNSLDVKKIIDSIDKKTVLFLDEIDKYLSPQSGIVSESQAKGLRTSFLTNFESKDIFWIFTGTFSDIRGDQKLNRELLEKTLGRELASRLSFSDYMMNDWNIDKLMRAAKNVLGKDKNIEYEDTAILKLVNYVLKYQGGVRGLEKNHESIKRRLHSINSRGNMLITVSHIDEHIQKEMEG